MIERMAKVEILGLKDVSMEAVDAIHDLGTLHIEDLSERIGLMETKRVSRMEMDPKFAEHEATLAVLRDRIGDRIRELKPTVEEIPREEIQKEYNAIWSDDIEAMIARVDRTLDEVERATRDPVEKKADMVVELSRLEKYAPIMAKVQPLTERVAQMPNMSSIALVIERKYKAVLNYLNEEISKITGGECEVISADVDDESTAALVVFNKHFLKQVHEFLAVQDVNQVRLPSDLANKPIDEAMKEVRARIAQIPDEIEKIERDLEDVTNKYTAKLLAARNAVHDRMETMDAVPKFGQTDQVFIISGWVPEGDVEPLEKRLADDFGNKVVVTVVDIREEREEEETPVALKNSPFTRYFEVIYLLSKYPKYGTVDPTIVFALFFPILFGMMVGDMGYGLVIMALGWFVHRKYKDKPLPNMIGYVLTVGGAWAVLFGALYLEFFGDWIARAVGATEGHYLLGSSTTLFKYPLDRLEGFTFMFGLVIIVGFVHMGVGLVIGMINGFKEKDTKHVMEKGGLLMVLTGIMLALAKFAFGWWPSLIVIVGVLLAIIGIVLSGIGAGMGGVIESVVGAGNLFSYIRLLAIGLASVIMANVANQLFRDNSSKGVIGIVVGVIVLLLLHTLNIVIAMFSPSIHALRLHLVESFGKFFEPAKYRYEPFKKSGGEE